MPTFFFFQVKNCLSLTLKVVFSIFSFWILFFLLIFQFKSSLKLILVRCQQNICLDQKWKKNNLKRTTNQHPTNQLHVNLKGSSASCSLRSGMLALDTGFFFFFNRTFLRRTLRGEAISDRETLCFRGLQSSLNEQIKKGYFFAKSALDILPSYIHSKKNTLC